MNYRFFRYIFFIVMSICLGWGLALAAPAAGHLTVTPERVNVGTFFSGKTLTISGDIPGSADVVVEVAGKDSRNLFDLKGKIGPFWMTRGKVHIDHVPELYLLLLPGGKDWEERINALGVGFGRLKSRMTTNGSVDIPPDIFSMFLQLKTAQSAYAEQKDAITYTVNPDGTRHFTAVCRLPAAVGEGRYTIQATTIDGNQVDGVATRTLTVEEVGFIKLVNYLASERRILYGVTAVIIALIAGLGMGIIFKQSGGAH